MDNFEKPTPQTFDNPYFVLPERAESDKLSFSYYKCCPNCMLILCITIFTIPAAISLIMLSPIFIIIVIIVYISIIILLLLNCKSNIELIKDKANNRITMIEKYCICCKKIINLSLENTVLKGRYYYTQGEKDHYSYILALNINPNEIDLDLDKSNIRNTPFKYLSKLCVVNSGKEQLELQLKSISKSEFKNKVKEEIDLYHPPRKYRSLKDDFDLYDSYLVKLSDHFYIFYTYPYLLIDKPNDNFERLDWIYTKDFDRIFLGVVKNDSSYANNFIFNTDIIDKFVLEIYDENFRLKIILKTGVKTEICQFLKELKIQLDIFISLINGQINKINNVNQVTSDNSAPTIE